MAITIIGLCLGSFFFGAYVASALIARAQHRTAQRLFGNGMKMHRQAIDASRIVRLR